MINTIQLTPSRRKIVLTASKFAVLCGILLSGFQATAQSGFEFGIRYMVTGSALFNGSDKAAGPELDRTSTMSYLSGGIAGTYNFNNHTGLEVDVLYSRQGQNYGGNNMFTANSAAYNHEVMLQAALNNDVSIGSYKAKAELNCIKIPVLLNLTTNKAKNVYYSMSIGPQINILKSAVYEINKEDVTLPGTNIEPNDAYRSITFDGVLALGAGFHLSQRFTATIQARFDYGFQDVENKNATYSFMGAPSQKYYGDGRAATHNATAALMIGLNYRL